MTYIHEGKVTKYCMIENCDVVGFFFGSIITYFLDVCPNSVENSIWWVLLQPVFHIISSLKKWQMTRIKGNSRAILRFSLLRLSIILICCHLDSMYAIISSPDDSAFQSFFLFKDRLFYKTAKPKHISSIHISSSHFIEWISFLDSKCLNYIIEVLIVLTFKNTWIGMPADHGFDLVIETSEYNFSWRTSLMIFINLQIYF